MQLTPTTERQMLWIEKNRNKNGQSKDFSGELLHRAIDRYTGNKAYDRKTLPRKVDLFQLKIAVRSLSFAPKTRDREIKEKEKGQKPVSQSSI